VPNFIAATYLMNYHAEHNIRPSEVKINNSILDTVCLTSGIHMATIERLIAWPLEEIKALNPVYKTTYIPFTNPPQCITGPLDKIGLLVSLEDSLYKLEKSIYSATPPPAVSPVQDTPVADTTVVSNTAEPFFYHTVKTGETMTGISTKYLVSVDSLKVWNELQTVNIYPGQRLKIMGKNKSTPPPPPAPTVKYYAVRSGDTFSKIAAKHRMSITQLRNLNPKININRLTVGQRIRIR
jgi:membrane-bound lytic murein transglycosylase D